ncbi:islet cell autoantigen 1 [Ischnura elegans]|uniref:islet cell autoantigen 1 n=1 Tax=Ischnura elegans TaxID=197161 RepID=UPI001ED877C0|nr:islet cell autoantigen 1 [Ischnura elegans]
MNSMRTGGAIGSSPYDRWLDQEQNNSALTKMQHHFWVTKQTVFRKLGKKEDECIVASDAELDAKLELFRSVQETCLDLLRIIEKYQEGLCNLAQEENSMGRFLKEAGKNDKTKAGKMMVAVGKSLSYSGQQRLTLRMPLVRLYQEVETFRLRAIEDTLQNVNAMEKVRTEYRASLKWMKNVSQELDPDTYKQLERFRKVQSQVRRSKVRFDQLKLDCLQKVDLLAAARCNMFSHALVLYQNSLLDFAKKANKTFSSVSNSFKGYQHYEFSVIKELSEPSLKLAEQTKEGATEDKDKLLFFDAEYRDDEDGEEDPSNTSPTAKKESSSAEPKNSAKEGTAAKVQPKTASGADSEDDELLVNITNDGKEDGSSVPAEGNKKDSLSLLEDVLLGDGPFSSEWMAVFGSSDATVGGGVGGVGEGGGLFGDSEAIAKGDAPSFLPSHLLDSSGLDLVDMLLPAPKGGASAATVDSVKEPGASVPPQQPSGTVLPSTNPPSLDSGVSPAKKKTQTSGRDMSKWFNLFADLDPLANPDAIGGRTEESDRNC